MHSFALTQIQDITNQAMRQNGTARPQTFLRLLGPIHDRWHKTSARRIGFLLFHWHVIESFKKVGGPQFLGGIMPFSLNDFRSMRVPYDVNVPISNGNIAQLIDFSDRIERWHGDAHMAIETKYNVPMMNPLVNIQYPQFWRLHYFINSMFIGALKQYFGARSSTPTQVSNWINTIEQTNHTSVPSI